MSILKNLFGKKDEKPRQVFPNRGLNLQLEPTPKNGKGLSEFFIGAVKENEGINLDYSVDTLNFVDQFLENFSKELKVDDFAETIFVAGCYCGQVMIENANGRWIKQEDANLPNGVIMMPIVIKLPNGTVCDPIAKAFKRFANGETDSLSYFYQVFTKTDKG
ncbi:MAG: hypothetical protein ACFHU9_00560 [Fluviicola sp.]